MDKKTQTELEAAAFRRLLKHLDDNKDVQNIDLMIVADFCRNCLSKWYLAAAQEQGVELTDEQAREYVYKMPYSEWKANHQTPATEEQKAKFSARQKA
ncbi:DUF1244 domain-containing protein [Glaciecola sp. XM2]|jgi:hypothetical protein|uniref:DUF1244 domain-containing protein n=1 Tax=Glaciecola sp. XM2 TaxID=1914931 RepID=UPI001BDF2FD4|nr:DUF1244 domain-containing protein [Glaciecola sp. XM2]MBT1452017.1 DUF1244 domain-containing protein [Glaciecola sp. XM2]